MELICPKCGERHPFNGNRYREIRLETGWAEEGDFTSEHYIELQGLCGTCAESVFQELAGIFESYGAE